VHLRTPISTSRAPYVPASAGFFDAVSPQALGSVFVLLALIIGLGYGAYAVLQDIQRVQFAPLDAPEAVAALPVVPDAPATAAPGNTQASLDQLYRPQELEVPVMVPRDGPIVNLDPARSGALVPANGTLSARETSAQLELATPRVTEPAAPQVAIVAARPAWVRVSLTDGSILFEKILDGGESFVLPANAQSTSLRAGNAGSVYLTLDGKAYGPVGNGTSVVKDVALAAAGVAESYPAVSDNAELKALESPRVITLNDVAASQ